MVFFSTYHQRKKKIDKKFHNCMKYSTRPVRSTGMFYYKRKVLFANKRPDKA